MRGHDLVRFAARASGAYATLEVRLDLAAQLRVLEAGEDFFVAALERPSPKLGASMSRGVWILIDGDVDAARPRLIDHPQRVDALAPASPSQQLLMGYFGRQFAAFADRDGFPH